MAKFSHVCVAILSIVAVESAVLSGKALFCRDPDTGKLHTVNSTWASSTFCGNYTCKLRRRNLTETEYTPIRSLNITNIRNESSINNITNQNNITVAIEERTEPEIEQVIHKDRTTEDNTKNSQEKIINDKIIEPVMLKKAVTVHNLLNYKAETIVENKQKNTEDVATDLANVMSNMAKNKSDESRYLTEKEISSIAEVLQTVKKSDLDAIVDIYNLAQDIYNEMDKATNEGIIDDTINAISNEALHKTKKSYWYDPLAYKGRVDMDYQGSNHVTTTTKPKQNVPTYFNGPLTNQDFGKLPYYYPLSNFQRTSSYNHHPKKTTKVERRPCKDNPKPKDMQVEAQNVIKPSYLLPYPFAYIHHYNYTDFPFNSFYNIPYTWDYYNRQRQYQPYYNAYLTQVPNIPNAVLMNPQLHEEVNNVEQKPVGDKDIIGKIIMKSNEKIIPDWQTEQLSSQILDEVRAKIDTTKFLKAFPFRKKINLEKVGKVIKLDELTRSRRSVDKEEVKEVTASPIEEEGEFETFLEKTKCQNQVVPGYFRYGNLTQPFPDCCPQLINNR